MKHTRRIKRRRIIAIIILILLILLSLWLFIRASEDEQKPYESYRHNILGIAGDFCVFTKEDATLSQVSADVAVGGNFKAQGFGDYETGWNFYKEHLECVNLNSYIGGHYESGTYHWKGNKKRAELTCSIDNSCKGTYKGEHQYGQANLYIYTGDESVKNNCESTNNENQCRINGKDYDNPICNDEKCTHGGKYNAYNVIECDYKFINFDEEFNNLVRLSERLKTLGEAIQVDCDTKNCGNRTFTYNIPDNQEMTIITLDANNFFNATNCDTFNIDGLDSNKQIIINVDCTGSFSTECPTTPKIKINNDDKDWNYLAENIIWNFYYPDNSGEAQLEAKEMVGTILAPNIDVTINGNLDGAVIAKKIPYANTINGINCSINSIGEGKEKEETTSVYVEKEWIDGNEEDKRPDKVQFKLLADGQEKGLVELRKEGQIIEFKDIEQKDEDGNETTAKSISYSTNGNRIKTIAQERAESEKYYIELDISDVESNWWEFAEQDITFTITDKNGQTTKKTVKAKTLTSWAFDSSFTVDVPKGSSVDVNFETTCINSTYGNQSKCYMASITTKTNACGVKVNWPKDCNWITVKLSATPCDCTPNITIQNGDSSDTDITTPTTPSGGDNQTEGNEQQGGGLVGSGGNTGSEETKEPEVQKPTEDENLKDWSCKIINLPKYEENNDGKEIVYTIEEVDVGENYESKIEEVKDESGNSTTPRKFKITNTLLTEIEGEKIWQDDNFENRPDEIEITLYKKVTTDGEEKEEIVTLDKNEDSEDAPEAVSTDEDNTTEEEKKEKFKNPITLKKEEQKEKGDNWTFKFGKLPKYDKDNNKIEYVVKEEIKDENAKERYTTTYENKEDKFIITNKYEIEETSIKVTKKWEDNNNQDGFRPKKLEVTLLADGEVVKLKDKDGKVTDAVAVLSEDNDWTYTFENLPKTKDGKDIEYTVEEAIKYKKAKGKYEVEYQKTDDGYVIVNTHIPEKTSVEGSKIWKDEDNQDGLRPNEVVVKLFENGKEIQSQKVTEDNGWKFKFDNLDKYKDGSKIEYTVSEESINGYTQDIDENYNITNTHKPETINVEVTKNWDDNDNQDGLRPKEITIKLFADGEELKDKAQVVTSKDKWSYTFKNLPKFKNGQEIVYTVDEASIDKYEKVVNKKESTKKTEDGRDIVEYEITNTHEPAKIEVKGTKTWDDGDNQDGLRPKNIKVKLYADEKEKAEKTVTAEDNWEYSFDNLDKYKAGVEIKYTIYEEPVDNYETTIKGFNITNKHVPATTEVSGKKTWDDNKNQDGMRPSEIKVKLLADGEVKDTKVVTEKDDWKYSFEDLPKYKTGVEIEYTISEDTVENYTTKVDGYNITNTHEPIKIEVSGKKTWEDNENQDGKRPESITVRIFANDVELSDKAQTVTEADKWEYTFIDLPKFKNGEEITYTIQEDKVKYYETEVKGYNITNKHTPEKTTVSGTKTWQDANDQDGKRPDKVTVQLYADGEKMEGKTATASEETDWKYEFKDLDKYKAGKEIVYTVEEEAVEKYETKINKYDIVNIHEPEKISVVGQKTWDDADDQDGLRPKSITVKLLANGQEVKDKTATVTADNDWKYTFKDVDKYQNGEEIVYTVEEVKVTGYESKVDGMNLTNTHEPAKTEVAGEKIWKDNEDQDGLRPKAITINLLADGKKIKSVTIGEKDGWKYSFTDLDKNKKGKPINYTVDEEKVEGYTKSIDGNNITNTHEIEKTEISGKKIWKDNNDQDGKRPEEVTIQLVADGQEVKGETATASESTGWKYKFADLPKNEKGKKINYTVKEIIVDGYETSIDGYEITNTHTPETINVDCKKTWVDDNNKDGKRPDKVTIKLLANGEEIESKEVIAKDWTYTFKNLPRYEKGKEINYTIKETNVTGYDTTIDGYNITNTHATEKTEVSGKKTWVDNENQDGKRPEKITVNLLADGEKVDSKEVTAEENWKYTFDNLEKYKNGKLIKYEISEEKVDGYTTKVDGYNITNTHKANTTKVEGTKKWIDTGFEEHRPKTITIRLFADGEEVQHKKINANGKWEYEFDNLPEYKNGKKIEYTIKEDDIDGYEIIINGFDITNRYYAVAGEEVIDIDVEKVWEDKGYESIRPNKVTVYLLANGEVVRTKEITAQDKWKATFKQLDLYDADDNEITYTVEEDAIAGYETRIDRFKITNIYVPAEVEDKIMIKVNKYEKGTTKKLKDAKFELVIKKEDGKDKDNKKKYKEVLKKTNTTNSIGQIILKDLDLEEGTYVLELNEKEAPKGYKKSDDSIKIEFTVKEKNGKKVVELKNKNKNVQVEKTTMTIKVENAKEQKKDNTTSKGKLPQTGLGNMVIAGIVIVGFLAVGAIGIFKYREVKY